MPLSKSIVFAPSLKTPNLSIVTAFQILIKAAGLRTLWLGIASVVAGTAAAAAHGNLQPFPALACLLFAIFAPCAGEDQECRHRIKHRAAQRMWSGVAYDHNYRDKRGEENSPPSRHRQHCQSCSSCQNREHLYTLLENVGQRTVDIIGIDKYICKFTPF